MRIFPRTFKYCLAAMAVCMASAKASDNSLEKGWEYLDGFRFNEAHKSFTQGNGNSTGAGRERKLGEAVTLLNVQPRTEGNISKAAEMLQELTSTNTLDDVDTFARFFLARILEMHQTPRDFAKARAAYLDLFKLRPGAPVAEFAASKVVLIDLYDNIPPAEFERRLGELEKLEPLFKTSLGRREFHSNIGMACAELSGPDRKIIEHLVAADKEGYTQWQTESVVWVLIGATAEKMGDKELAKQYYGKFVAKYKRDNRCYTILEKLKHLEANP